MNDKEDGSFETSVQWCADRGRVGNLESSLRGRKLFGRDEKDRRNGSEGTEWEGAVKGSNKKQNN